jgi:hypothetical protein
VRCANHPDVETNLKCGKCGKPICPRCLVQTPVGARCAECAQLHKLPTFHVTRGYYLRAAAVTVGMAFACGAAWWALRVVGVPYFSFLLASGFGYAISEVLSRVVNRKRGRNLAVIAGVGVALSFVISVFPPWSVWYWYFPVPSLVINLLAVGLGVWIAVSRIR